MIKHYFKTSNYLLDLNYKIDEQNYLIIIIIKINLKIKK